MLHLNALCLYLKAHIVLGQWPLKLDAKASLLVTFSYTLYKVHLVGLLINIIRLQCSAGVFCSILRGELHLILSELIELSNHTEDRDKNISPEVATQRMDRAERMAIVCCDLLDNIATFLIGGETSEEIVNTNSGVWETLPFQSLLDLQKVNEFVCFILHSNLRFRIPFFPQDIAGIFLDIREFLDANCVSLEFLSEEYDSCWSVGAINRQVTSSPKGRVIERCKQSVLLWCSEDETVLAVFQGLSL